MARQAQGRWLVRIDDLDPPREVAGAADAILALLETLGLTWDGEVVYQSRRHAAYDDALARLDAAGRLFDCGCSRREVGRGPYPGTCRNGLPRGRKARAVRVRVDDTPIVFEDALQGAVSARLSETCGDFVVRRADGLYAYHIAVVVDDAAAGVSEIVRGVDLLDSTPQQICLQRLLGLPTPAYRHLPVALNEYGNKLSKQTRAAAVTAASAGRDVADALRFLGCELPAEIALAPPALQLEWARQHWQPAACDPAARTYRASASVNMPRSSS